MARRTHIATWRKTIISAAVTVGLAVGLPPASVSAPTTPSNPSASPGDDETDATTSNTSGTVGISARVVGIHVVSDAAERRLRRDISPKLSALADDFRACYRTHALGDSEADRTIHVDWTVTTDGEPVDVTVFTSHTGLEGCIARSLTGISFASVEDRHPRVRVAVDFSS